ncbi:MAG: rod-binding protein [Spirochaetaceae bacterium]|jgi:flagellar protein FlgJ|nr:rod-binding protein [Spirochaetaceae bacterium]
MKLETISALYLDAGRFTPAPALEKAAQTGTTFSALLEKNSAASDGAKKPVIDKTDKLYEQCEALETFLIKNLLNSMRSTIQKSGFIDESFAGKMYEDMLYDEYAQDFSRNADFGLAELAYLELTAAQR